MPPTGPRKGLTQQNGEAMKSIFCEAFQVKNGHEHVCTEMADHKGDHRCLCDSWASVPNAAPASLDTREGQNVTGSMREIPNG